MVPYVLALFGSLKPASQILTEAPWALPHHLEWSNYYDHTVPAGLHPVPRQHGPRDGDIDGGAGCVQRDRCVCVCPAEVPRTGSNFLVLPGHTYDAQHRDHHPALHDRAKLHLLGTYWAIFLPYVFGTPYTIFLIRQFFMNIPQEIIDASKMDGCSEIGTSGRSWSRYPAPSSLRPRSSPSFSAGTISSGR